MNTDSKPLRTTERLQRVNDETWVAIGRTGEMMELNSTSVALLELCDGMTQVAEMAEAVALLTDRSTELIEREVLEALAALEAGGLIENG